MSALDRALDEARLAGFWRRVHLAVHDGLVVLERQPTPVTWAPGLAEAMTARGYAVYEEQLVTELL